MRASAAWLYVVDLERPRMAVMAARPRLRTLIPLQSHLPALATGRARRPDRGSADSTRCSLKRFCCATHVVADKAPVDHPGVAQ